jgi:replicative DNA helicase
MKVRIEDAVEEAVLGSMLLDNDVIDAVLKHSPDLSD